MSASAMGAERALRVIYRSHAGENRKRRPLYYTKRLSLLSFLRALDQVHAPKEVVFLNDGPVPRGQLELMHRAGQVRQVDGGSNRASHRIALTLPGQLGWHGEDVVWFSEDDYLYTPGALGHLLEAAGALPDADYFALYGSARLALGCCRSHPSVAPLAGSEGDLEARRVGESSWFRAMSTTSTFGARARTLLEDVRLHRWLAYTGGAWDHTTCLVYQGLKPFPWQHVIADLVAPPGLPARARARIAGRAVVRSAANGAAAWRSRRPRVLVGVDPELITHMELPLLADGTDWAAVAASTARWAAGQGYLSSWEVRV